MKMHLQISNNGRIIIPKKIRDLLKIKSGSAVVADVVGDTLQLTSINNSLRKAREQVKKYCSSDDISLVDELFLMRKEEVATEQEKFDIASNYNTKTDINHD